MFSLRDEKAPFFIIDILIDEPFDFSEVCRRKKEIKLGDTVIPIVPIDTLIEMKEKNRKNSG